MERVKREIEELVHLETKAWDTKDAGLLVSIFHQDMVWPWPKDAMSHDPIDWVITQGRYNKDRWKQRWQHLFDTHELIHNRRVIRKIEVSKELDGAFAVVDLDTLWLSTEDVKNHWYGRVCKVYTKTNDGWKLIMHTGVLDYSGLENLRSTSE